MDIVDLAAIDLQICGVGRPTRTAHVLCMYFTCLPVINLPTRSKTGIRASSKRPIAVLAAAGELN